MTRRNLTAAILAVLLVVASFAAWRAYNSKQLGVVLDTEPFSVRTWPTGTRRTFHVAWATNAAARLEGAKQGELETAFDVEGDLAVDSYGAQGDALVLGLVWTRVDHAVAEALSKAIAPAGELATQLSNAESVIVVEPTGRIRELGFSEQTTPIARLVQRALALDIVADIASASGKVNVVDTALGRARIERKGELSRQGSVVTSRAEYEELDAFPLGLAETKPSLEAQNEIHTNQAGVVERIESTERLSLEAHGGMLSGYRSMTKLRATLRTESNHPRKSPPSFTPSSVRLVQDGGYDRHASLERRSLGVTPATLLSDVRSAALFPRAGTTQWIWRDAAYLELHPDAAQPLLDAAATLGTQATASASDIIVIAGTERGQAALVKMLEGPAAASEDAYVVLIQRLSYIVRPEQSLVAFVARERVRYRGTDRGHAAAYTLGSLAHHIAFDSPHVAEMIASDLLSDLVSAKSVEDRVVLLAALGNAGLVSTSDALLASASDQDPRIRKEAANALRKIDAPQVIDTLMNLLTDAAPAVASMAVDSLLRKQLRKEDWERLQRLVSENRLPPDTHGSLASALTRRIDEGAGPRSILDAMLASDKVSQDVKQRIESVVQH